MDLMVEERVFDASPLNCSSVHQRARVTDGRGRNGRKREKGRRNNNQTIPPLVSSRIRRVPGSDCESLAEIFTTNFAQQFEPDGPWSGRSINVQTPEAKRDCHVNT